MPHWIDNPAVDEGRQSPILCWADDIDADELREVPQKSEPSGYNQMEPPSCGGSSSSCQINGDDSNCGVTSSTSSEVQPSAPPLDEVMCLTCCSDILRTRCPEMEHECVRLRVSESYRCGGCGDEVPLGTEILVCENCPFDICTNCSGGINHANLIITDGDEIPTAPMIHDSEPVVVPQYSTLFPGFAPQNDYAILPVDLTTQEHKPPPTSYGHKTSRRRRRKKPSAPPQPYYHFYDDIVIG